MIPGRLYWVCGRLVIRNISTVLSRESNFGISARDGGAAQILDMLKVYHTSQIGGIVHNL